jgi:hypothetical protein
LRRKRRVSRGHACNAPKRHHHCWEKATFRILCLTVFSALTLSFATPYAYADDSDSRVDRRQERQKERVKHGVRSGELTRRETGGLVRGQVRVNRMERRAEADGKVTRKERLRLERAQNKQSRRIFRKKHNRRSR